MLRFFFPVGVFFFSGSLKVLIWDIEYGYSNHVRGRASSRSVVNGNHMDVIAPWQMSDVYFYVHLVVS